MKVIGDKNVKMGELPYTYSNKVFKIDNFMDRYV